MEEKPLPETTQPETTPLPPVQPAEAPPQPATPPSGQISHAPSAHLSPGLIVLQWLTYAFWGWTVLAMSVLTATVVANFVQGADSSGFTPYGIAAVLVLLPIAAVCDYYFSKYETAKKTGGASIVMVIHAVIFALFGIGSLIAAVFSIVSMLTSSGDSSGAVTTLISALIIFVLYGVTFLRTINPARFPQIKRLYLIFMILSVGLITLLGILGPVAYARETRDDKLIRNNLYLVQQEIENYARENGRLPSDLQSLDLSGDAQLLVDKNLVGYTPNTKEPLQKVVTSTPETTYYYELCVSYKESDKGTYSYGGLEDNDGYSTYVPTSGYDAGRNCYKLKSTEYNT